MHIWTTNTVCQPIKLSCGPWGVRIWRVWLILPLVGILWLLRLPLHGILPLCLRHVRPVILTCKSAQPFMILYTQPGVGWKRCSFI